MPDEPDPYLAPDAPVGEDFILVDPGPRTMRRFLVAAIHYAIAAFILTLEAIAIWITIDLWSRAGTRFENHPTRLGVREVFLVTCGCSGLAFLLAGRDFGKGRNDRGIGLSASGFAFIGLTVLATWLMPRPS